MKTYLRGLTKFEIILWLTSVCAIALSFAASGGGDWLTAVASLIGVTALIFVAKGDVLGQILTVIFAVFYGIISFFFRYYGEMITYLCMTAPIAVLTIISWLRHPYKGTREVAVGHLTRRQVWIMIISALSTTTAFYFILRALGNANLILSTVSVTTSFVASYLTFCRSEYYALGYAANDIVLVGLWVSAALHDISYLPMVTCFVMFLANDIYGYCSWKKMRRRQSCDKASDGTSDN